VFDPQAAKERGEAGIPAMASCPSTTEALHLTAEGYAYVGQLRSDLLAALKLIENQEPMVNQYKKIVEWLAKYVRSGESTADLLVRLSAALEALEEAQAHLKTVRWVLEMDDPRLLKALQTIERLLKERDGYAAQSKRRGEALEKVVSRWQSYRSETLPGRTRNQDLGYCAEDMKEIARDAIAISPEDAREKEKKA